MVITLTPETEAMLRRRAEQEGLDVDQVANTLLAAVLGREQPRNGITAAREEFNREDRPFRQDPRLTSIQFHEDPMAPLCPEEWPAAFE